MHVETREHVAAKQTRFGPVQQSMRQDYVYVKNETGQLEHVGYWSHVSKAFLPLRGFPVELCGEVAGELSELKGVACHSAPVPPEPPPPPKPELEIDEE